MPVKGAPSPLRFNLYAGWPSMQGRRTVQAGLKGAGGLSRPVGTSRTNEGFAREYKLGQGNRGRFEAGGCGSSALLPTSPAVTHHSSASLAVHYFCLRPEIFDGLSKQAVESRGVIIRVLKIMTQRARAILRTRLKRVDTCQPGCERLSEFVTLLPIPPRSAHRRCH